MKLYRVCYLSENEYRYDAMNGIGALELPGDVTIGLTGVYTPDYKKAKEILFTRHDALFSLGTGGISHAQIVEVDLGDVVAEKIRNDKYIVKRIEKPNILGSLLD